MNGAEAPDQIRRGYGDDRAAGEESGERRGRDGILCGFEGRHQDCAVGYIKVRVRGGQARAVVDDGRGHRESFDVEGAAVLIAHRAEAVKVVTQHRVVHVGGIVLQDGDDGVGGDKAGEVVDVAVGVVAGDSVAKPQDVGYAEISPQVILDVGAAEHGI